MAASSSRSKGTKSARRTKKRARKSAAKKPRGLLLVMMDIEPEHEEEFERWYAEEHLPDRVNCPGFLTARRFRAIEGGPKYMAFYDLDGPEVLETEAYRRIRTTPWTRAMEPRFKNFKRNIYVEIGSAKPARKRRRK
jgi:hypothetical protein